MGGRVIAAIIKTATGKTARTKGKTKDSLFVCLWDSASDLRLINFSFVVNPMISDKPLDDIMILLKQS
jgi:hypothetical protein